MPYVMKHETWMQLTNAGMLSVRSAQLKQIDNALLAYEHSPGQQTLAGLKLALHHWKMSKGYDGNGGKPGWVASERNRRNAVTTLDGQLFGMSKPLVNSVLKELAELPFYGIESWAEEEAAREVMKKAREEVLQEMFAGRELLFRRSSLVTFGAGVGHSLFKVKKFAAQTASAAAPAGGAARGGAMGALGSANQAANELVHGILSDLTPDLAREALDTLNQMLPNFIHELAASMAPYVGVIRSGAKTTQYLVTTIMARYKQYDVGNHQHAILPGDPAAAAAALLAMIKREVADNSAMAQIYATDTVLKGGALALDAAALGIPVGSAVVGPASGLFTSLAVLGMQVRTVARDVKEKKKANEMLKNASFRKLSPRLFQECPLLGCWYIACSNTSDVTNFLIADIGQRGWNLDVEVMIAKHVQPIIEAARGYIADSRFEVSGMQNMKGAVATTKGFMGIKNRLKGKMLTGIAKALPFVDDPRDYRTIAAKQGHTAVSPAELKKRIVGIGSP